MIMEKFREKLKLQKIEKIMNYLSGHMCDSHHMQLLLNTTVC